MRRIGLIASLALAVVALADAPRINRVAFEKLEGAMDSMLVSGDKPCVLEGNTRGVYVDGFGAVFTSIVSLATTPTVTPFYDLTKQTISLTRARKMTQVPVLRDKMRTMLLTLAASPALDSVRTNEQIVTGVTLFYYRWEDSHGLPSQIVMRGEKGKLLEVQTGRSPQTALESIVKIEEL